jgi:perosamine synthetase
MSDFIPVNEPDLTGNERKYLNECIDTGWISSEGPFIREFEARFAERVGRRHGIAVCNGSAALDAAAAALDIGPGDEVIMPTFTIISCAAAVSRLGGVPVVVDCDADTWNMDARSNRGSLHARARSCPFISMAFLSTWIRCSISRGDIAFWSLKMPPR